MLIHWSALAGTRSAPAAPGELYAFTQAGLARVHDLARAQNLMIIDTPAALPAMHQRQGAVRHVHHHAEPAA